MARNNCRNASPRRFFVPLLAGSFLTLLASLARVIDFDENGKLSFFKKTLAPDGQLYLAQALKFKGFELNEIIPRIRTFYPESEVLPIPIEFYEIASSRPLYPWLMSLLPLESLWELFIVPLFSYFLLMVVSSYRIWNSESTVKGWLILLIFSSSTYVRGALIANTTDALAALLLVLLVTQFFRIFHGRVRYPFMVAVLTLATGLSRPLGLVVFGISLVFAFYTKDELRKWGWFALSAMLSLSQLITSIVFQNQLNTQAKYSDSGEIGFRFALEVARNFLISPLVEFSYLFSHDSLLFFALVFLISRVLMFKSSLEISLVSVTLITLFLTGAVNGTLGVGFRYQMPFIFVLFVIFFNRKIPSVS